MSFDELTFAQKTLRRTNLIWIGEWPAQLRNHFCAFFVTWNSFSKCPFECMHKRGVVAVIWHAAVRDADLLFREPHFFLLGLWVFIFRNELIFKENFGHDIFVIIVQLNPVWKVSCLHEFWSLDVTITQNIWIFGIDLRWHQIGRVRARSCLRPSRSHWITDVFKPIRLLLSCPKCFLDILHKFNSD